MKPINEQINPKFVIQAQKLSHFKRLLHDILPAECHGHVEVANIRDQNLMLITDSPVWTTRLRQLSPQILQFIRENTPNGDDYKEQIIHHIQIRTRYSASEPNERHSAEQKHRPLLRISETTANLLSQSADSIEHQQLKAALLRIARHASSSGETDK